ncbi:sugar O-acetyltransferase [Parablautia intestinalis]|uniref:Acetyltransferase n=1 Tax=Parablautia intestinalis TaxID=2320100 RepID=A0A3A9AYQ1_9FIRM|nr:sugar O-acetyltransferase [Parablautia intestinalis]MCI8614674.1 sugar O-acetyltransferase [Lachnospiraceae bacterium]RKI92306.1 sugar O-acetyltransferase [Parablautia intestinalis]
MTEQEKMKKGYLWLDDEENMDLQAHTKSLVRKFNTLPPEDMEGREALLKDIFGNVGENVWIVPPLTAAVGKYVSIGEGTYANMNLTLIDDWQITIGKHVLIGPNVTLCTTGHSIHPKHRADGMYSFPITIEDNVWLGANVIVLPGVTIGENSVIGAGSVVTKDIPANVIAFGSPCKVYREINDHDAEYYFRDRRFDEQPE